MHSALEQLPVRNASRLFKALGDENRLRIVALLSHGELCVCHLESALELPQPTVSRLLGVLRNAGVVEARRAGNWMHYRLAPQADALCGRQLEELTGAFGKQRLLRDDVARLLESRRANDCK